MAESRAFMSEIPAKFAKYFWDYDLESLSIEKHRRLVIERILNFGDDQALEWLFERIDRESIKTVVQSGRELTDKTRNFWKFELFEEARDTLHGAIDGVKISFLRYDYPLLKPVRSLHHLRMAHLFDIALMKLSAISARGIKKDFVDMFFLLQHFSLSDLLTAFSVKYGEGLGQRYHLLKSLVYFQDAEEDPMPRMIQLVSWEEVKCFMIEQVKK
jgi:hypothetical protein